MSTLHIDDWEPPARKPPYPEIATEHELKYMPDANFNDLKRRVDAEHARRYQTSRTSNNTGSSTIKLNGNPY